MTTENIETGPKVYRWMLCLHDGAETDNGTVQATSLDEAMRLAMKDAFGGNSEEPHHQEPGLMSWACMAGATTLRVTLGMTENTITKTIDGLTATVRPIGENLYEITIADKVRGTIGRQGEDGDYPGRWYTQHLNIGENLEFGEDDTLDIAIEDFLLVYTTEPDLLTYV